MPPKAVHLIELYIMRFNLVAVAGTFDHLHLGHQKLLQTAKASGRKVIIGLCQKSMLTNKAFAQSIESYSVRQQAIAQFKPDGIIPLTDIFGPAATSTTINAIICSRLSRPNADKINQKRRLNNLNYLSIIEVPLVNSSDGQPLSSSRIRQGLINRQGLFYPSLFHHQLTLPASQRIHFQAPFEKILQAIKFNPSDFTIAVGDIAALAFAKQGLKPSLAIVDLHTQRHQVFKSLAELKLTSGLSATNPPGVIAPDLAKKILTCLTKNIPSLLVYGEEDLAVLPAVLLSPLKTTIYYGQPNQGIVKIMVTEKTKKKAQNLLKKFISLTSIPTPVLPPLSLRS